MLTAIFEVYEYKLSDVSFCRYGEGDNSTLFHKSHIVDTVFSKAERVWKKLETKMSSAATAQFYRCFLSEEKGVDDCLLRYTRYTLSAARPIENDLGHPDVLRLRETSRKVYREKHRMEAFVRFQLTSDGLYHSVIQPDYNVLPLITKHFKERYADQRWLIYDIRRKYGIYYDLNTVEQVEIDFNKLRLEPQSGNTNAGKTFADERVHTEEVCVKNAINRRSNDGLVCTGDAQVKVKKESSLPVVNIPGMDKNFADDSLIICLDEKEALCQQLWRHYFSNVNISERKNMKLHIRHMPKRYWRYLTEKNGPMNNPDMQFL